MHRVRALVGLSKLQQKDVCSEHPPLVRIPCPETWAQLLHQSDMQAWLVCCFASVGSLLAHSRAHFIP